MVSLVAFGIHVVRSLLSSKYFVLNKVLIRDEHKKDRQLIELIEKKKVSYQFLGRKEFENYRFGKNNQGIVVFIRKYIYLSLDEIIDKVTQKDDKFPLVIVLDSIEDPANFGAILRTSSALNIKAIVIGVKNQVPVNNTVIKVSAGGIAHIPICQVSNLVSAVQKFKENGYRIVSTVCQPQKQPYYKLKLSSPTCLIFGNEHKGIRQNLIRNSDFLVNIPVKNDMDSFNVAVSCAIICSWLVFTS